VKVPKVAIKKVKEVTSSGATVTSLKLTEPYEWQLGEDPRGWYVFEQLPGAFRVYWDGAKLLWKYAFF
jgi:hypothetical protein